MEVLDRLPDHIDAQAADNDLVRFNIHAGFSPDQRPDQRALGRPDVPESRCELPSP
jgi:hypothetical protein